MKELEPNEKVFAVEAPLPRLKNVFDNPDIIATAVVI
jgi:hypothetical protein